MRTTFKVANPRMSATSQTSANKPNIQMSRAFWSQFGSGMPTHFKRFPQGIVVTCKVKSHGPSDLGGSISPAAPIAPE